MDMNKHGDPSNCTLKFTIRRPSPLKREKMDQHPHQFGLSRSASDWRGLPLSTARLTHVPDRATAPLVVQRQTARRRAVGGVSIGIDSPPKKHVLAMACSDAVTRSCMATLLFREV